MFENVFCSKIDVCDLDVDPMTLVLKADADIVLTDLHATNEVNKSKDSNVITWIDRQTCVKPLPACYHTWQIEQNLCISII